MCVYVCLCMCVYVYMYAEPEEENVMDKLKENLIHEELLNTQALLRSRISQERNEINRLTKMLMERGTEKKKPKERTHSPNDAEMTAMMQLIEENNLLEVCSSFCLFIPFFYAFLLTHLNISCNRKS